MVTRLHFGHNFYNSELEVYRETIERYGYGDKIRITDTAYSDRGCLLDGCSALWHDPSVNLTEFGDRAREMRKELYPGFA